MDVLKEQIDENFRQIGLTQTNTHEKIMQMDVKISSVSEAMAGFQEAQEKSFLKLVQSIKDLPQGDISVTKKTTSEKK